MDPTCYRRPLGSAWRADGAGGYPLNSRASDRVDPEGISGAAPTRWQTKMDSTGEGRAHPAQGDWGDDHSTMEWVRRAAQANGSAQYTLYVAHLQASFIKMSAIKPLADKPRMMAVARLLWCLWGN